MHLDLTSPGTQAGLAQLAGISEARVSQLVTRGVIPTDVTLQEMMHAYCCHLRYQVARRLGATIVLSEVPECFTTQAALPT